MLFLGFFHELTGCGSQDAFAAHLAEGGGDRITEYEQNTCIDIINTPCMKN